MRSLYQDLSQATRSISIQITNGKILAQTHTQSILTAIFQGETGLAGCPLNSPSPFIPGLASFWDRPKLSMSLLTQSHQVFFGHPLCLIPSTSHIIQHLTQSLSSFIQHV